MPNFGTRINNIPSLSGASVNDYLLITANVNGEWLSRKITAETFATTLGLSGVDLSTIQANIITLSGDVSYISGIVDANDEFVRSNFIILSGDVSYISGIVDTNTSNITTNANNITSNDSDINYLSGIVDTNEVFVRSNFIPVSGSSDITGDLTPATTNNYSLGTSAYQDRKSVV